jgi:DNA polymerase elongation subunit (family B)
MFSNRKSNILHGKTIKYKGFSSLYEIPDRSYYTDSKCRKSNDEIIEEMKIGISDRPLLFLPTSFGEFHEKSLSNQNEYRILLFGILSDGTKTSVILEGFDPYFKVRKPVDIDKKTFERKVNSILNESFHGSYCNLYNSKGFNNYEKNTYPFMRLNFKTTWDRKNAIKYFRETLQWETTSDDRNHMERVICRDSSFSLTLWNEIIRFKSYKKEEQCKLDKTFRVKYQDIIKYDGDIIGNDYLARDKTIVETWDIEAFTDSGEMPDPERKQDPVFSIGKTYHWRSDSTSLLEICICSRDSDAHPDKLTIICINERDLIKACFDVHKKMKPDYITGFNDGDFDWVFVIKKAVKHGVLLYIREQLNLMKNKYSYEKKTLKEKQHQTLKWDVKKQSIKLEADMNAYSTTLCMPGYTCIDTRTAYRQLHPTEPKSSLKYFLALSNLGGKQDMPIHVLFRIFADSLKIENAIDEKIKSNDVTGIGELQKQMNENKKQMSEVNNYCTIDAKKCQELLIKGNIIGDRREISDVSKTSFYDAIYFANGMKVRNLIIAEGQKCGLEFSTIPAPYIGDGHYPGAYVFPPIKGVVRPKLTVWERKKYKFKWKDVPTSDIKLMEQKIWEYWGVICRDHHINDVKDIDKRSAVKIMVESAEFEYKKSKELFYEFATDENLFPVSGLDFASLYPSIIMAYNLSPEYMLFTEKDAENARNDGHTLHEINFEFKPKKDPSYPVRAWSIRHDTFDGETLKKGKVNAKFGLYCYILKTLKIKRSVIKKVKKTLGERMEQMKKNGNQETEEYKKVCFQYDYTDSKQKALKVFMNTFYGETGNKHSAFFVLAIAGGITSAGQRNIKMVAEFVINMGCKLYYGDTDSVYISCPAKYFVELERMYYSGQMTKVDYCTALVKETFVQIEKIKNLVNKMLVADNGTNFLLVDFEEVLFPAVFLKKKMYAGVAHEKIVNFFPKNYKELFMKGLSLKRRGVSGVLKTVCGEVLMELLSINSVSTLEEVIHNKIQEVYNRDWKMEDFKKTAVYKPNKNNVSVRVFYSLMEERNDPDCPLPQPAERFDYVVVKKYPFKYDLKGRKTKLKVGERWEYYTYAKKHELVIDLNYYMEGGIIGQFGQFMACVPQFQIIPENKTDHARDIAEVKTLNSAKKHIKEICKRYANTPLCQGPLMKKLYKIANTAYVESGGKERYSFSDCDLFKSIKDSIENDKKKSSEYYANCYVDYMQKKFGKNIIYSLFKIFNSSDNSLLKYRTIHAKKIEMEAKLDFRQNKKEYALLFASRNNFIKNKIRQMKLAVGVVNDNLWDGNIDIKTLDEDERIHAIVGVQNETQNNLHEDIMEKFDNVYTKLRVSSTYIAQTKSIIDEVKFRMDMRQQLNTIPPSIDVNDEHQQAIEFIKNNIIDF